MLPEVLKRIVLKAGCEDRLKVGLDSCIESLNTCDPIKILAVILTDNSEDLFSQTILETYCYEQSIPFMKTDLRILRRMLKCIQSGSKDTDPTCMIIMVNIIITYLFLRFIRWLIVFIILETSKQFDQLRWARASKGDKPLRNE